MAKLSNLLLNEGTTTGCHACREKDPELFPFTMAFQPMVNCLTRTCAWKRLRRAQMLLQCGAYLLQGYLFRKPALEVLPKISGPRCTPRRAARRRVAGCEASAAAGL